MCTLSVKIQRSVFKNSIICFCRTWLEQKPVQCRSLRTGVENHYAKCLTHTNTTHTHDAFTLTHTPRRVHTNTHSPTPTALNIEVLETGGTQHVWTRAPDAPEVCFHFLCFRLVLNFFYFCKQFLKNKQTSKQANKNTPEYSLHCFPLLTPIYFSYELTVYFFFSIIANVRTVKHQKPAVY